MARIRHSAGSTTKEQPMAVLERTLAAIHPGMTYQELLTYGRTNTGSHKDAPGILSRRFLQVQNGQIVYVHFLSTLAAEGFSERVRKIMYFLWVFRDDRLRGFICERVADANGHWQEAELTRIENMDYFNPFFAPGTDTAQKTRSNLEHRLLEWNIYRPGEIPPIRLDLGDRWLEDGMRAAAQHENDPVRRAAMVTSPGQYLVANGWHGMTNVTPVELLGVASATADTTDPLEDLGVPTAITPPTRGQSWNRPVPTPADVAAAVASTNPVAKERARQSHHRLEKLTADIVRATELDPRYNALIDLYFQNGEV